MQELIIISDAFRNSRQRFFSAFKKDNAQSISYHLNQEAVMTRFLKKKAESVPEFILIKVKKNKYHDDFISFLPPLAALVYPLLLMRFHALINDIEVKRENIFWSFIIMACAFSVPVIGMLVVCRSNLRINLRRLAYWCVVAPTLYVFLGVLQTLISSPIPDLWVWFIGWGMITVYSAKSGLSAPQPKPMKILGYWRVAHGITAIVLCIFVLFHLTNHLVGLLGTAEHSAFMNIGRKVYRSQLIEPLLILSMLFQTICGLRLAWHWSTITPDFYRAFQIASGVYLSVFILGHMNSVFIYARIYSDIPTDWGFAIGAPAGLLHDAWNIRLLPHYAFGVFFMLGHIFSGIRVILNAHCGTRNQRIIDAFWLLGILSSALIAIIIIVAMIGVRI